MLDDLLNHFPIEENWMQDFGYVHIIVLYSKRRQEHYMLKELEKVTLLFKKYRDGYRLHRVHERKDFYE